MAVTRRNSKTNSDFARKEGAQTLVQIILLLFALTHFSIACSSKGKKNSISQREAKAINEKNESPLTILEIEGENFQAKFSPQGDAIIFVSQKRPAHLQSQIYRMNLKTGEEQRLTYQDGENSAPIYDPSGNGFLYASTTDELKEDPVFIKESLARMKGEKLETNAEGDLSQPYEIYWSNWNGTYIQRLTETKGYDSTPMVHPTGTRVVFSSSRSGRHNIYSMSKDGKALKQLSWGKTDEVDPAYSPDGKSLIWVRYNQDRSESQLVIASSLGRNPVVITSAPALHLSPRWFPNGEWIVFSSDRGEKNNFDLYSIKKDGSCLQRLSFHKAPDLSPDVSPDGKFITFTSERTGTSQVHLMQYSEPGSCPEDPPSVR